jgi:hypothetical protein
VADERELMRDALKRSMGEASFAEIRERFDERVQSGGLIEVESKSPARAFTTEEIQLARKSNLSLHEASALPKKDKATVWGMGLA